jgi:hypothetical protein
MVPVDAVFLAMPFVPGVADNGQHGRKAIL